MDYGSKIIGSPPRNLLLIEKCHYSGQKLVTYDHAEIMTFYLAEFYISADCLQLHFGCHRKNLHNYVFLFDIEKRNVE